MLKHFAILVCAFGLASSCWAQDLSHEEDTKPKKESTRIGKPRKEPKPAVVPKKSEPKPRPVTVLFPAAGDSYYLHIDNEQYGRVAKDSSKLVKLIPGKHILAFESATTGETIKDSNFLLIRDAARDGAFHYRPISFQYTNQQKIIDTIKNSAPTHTSAAPANPDTGNSTLEGNSKPENGNKHEVESKPPVSTISSNKTVANGASMITPEHTPVISKEMTMVTELSSNMVLLPAATFRMGVEGGASDEVPHEVTLSPIKFSKYEVTQRQWETIMGYNDSRNKGCPDCPVENVSWQEVDSFIAKVNRLSKAKVRLPTEAEWEYAAKYGLESQIGSIYSPKDFKKKSKEFLDKTAWYKNNANGNTHPVGQKQPSALGIYDLFGNVAEWCLDFYIPNYEKNSPSNPRGPSIGERKVVRGGSFDDDEASIRPPRREKEKPSTKRKNIGFRLVMEANS